MNYKQSNDQLTDLSPEPKTCQSNKKVKLANNHLISQVQYLFTNFTGTQKKKHFISKLQEKILQCPDFDLSPFLHENDITPELIDIYQNGKKLEKKAAIELIISLSKNSSDIAQHIESLYDFFNDLKNTQFGLEVLRLITCFLEYFPDLTSKLHQHDIFSYLFSEVLENDENQEFINDSMDFMITAIDTKELFHKDYEKEWLPLYQILRDLCSFLFLKKHNKNPKAQKLRVLILQNLAFMDSVDNIETVITPIVEEGICQSIGKGDNLIEYIEFLELLIEKHQIYLLDLLQNTPIIMSLLRLMKIEDFFIPIVNFFFKVADISIDASALLINFGVLDIFAEEENKFEIVKNEVPIGDAPESPNDASAFLVTHLVIDGLSEDKKGAILRLFIIFCITQPTAMRENEKMIHYLELAFDFLPLAEENFCLLYVIALRNLFDDGMTEESLHETSEIVDWLEDCLTNCENEEIVEISQYVLNKYLSS